jgi:hypothetical protein
MLARRCDGTPIVSFFALLYEPMDMYLLLAQADDHLPVLPDGLPARAAWDAQRPGFDPPAPTILANRSAAVDALPIQRWAIIAPRGPAGDRLLRLIAPLRRRREEEQKAQAHVYRVEPGMGFGASNAWIGQDYWDEVGRIEDDLARYVLVLGGPELVSWELQQMLGSEAFVGRLAFPDDRGYEAYVEKALRWEVEEAAQGVRSLFYTVQDGTPATVAGHEHVVAPSVRLARERAANGWFPASEIVEIGGSEPVPDNKIAEGAQAMLREAEQSPAGLLFALGHGAGTPRQGWSSPEEQRAHQGALVIGRSGGRIAAPDLAERTFLPGGLCFLLSCFSAGTPAQSAYHPWLDRLHRLGSTGPADRVLASLPRTGEPPFAAALPQAALSNPRGPLGVIGHVDLAWTWGFLDTERASDRPATNRRAERFQGLLRSLVEGHRFGVAHQELARFFGSISTELATMYGEDATPGHEDDEARQTRRASLWMQRQDLCGYVLLGDPAARLPIALRPQGVLPRGARPDASSAAAETHPGAASVLGVQPIRAARTRDPEHAEAAVLAVLRGGEEGAIAAQHGVSAAEIRRWVGAFLEGGRAALRKLP